MHVTLETNLCRPRWTRPSRVWLTSGQGEILLSCRMGPPNLPLWISRLLPHSPSKSFAITVVAFAVLRPNQKSTLALGNLLLTLTFFPL